MRRPDQRQTPRSSRQKLCALSLLAVSATSACATLDAPDEPMSIWFTHPGSSYHEAGPIGNGRLGAMDLGGVLQQRVVLNESSMWSGGPYEANRADAWKCLPEVREKLFAGDIGGAQAMLNAEFRYPDGVNGWFDDSQFGCYQVLGDLRIEYEYPSQKMLAITSPSGHARGDGKTIENASDGNTGTKWCVSDAGDRVRWQVRLPEAKPVTTYSFTSADDVPARDPQEWVLEGSEDGQAWVILDRRNPGQPFEKRHQRKAFTVQQPGVYLHYRFTFIPRIAYFQVAEITLGDLALRADTPTGDYRRDLNLMTGVARTRFTVDGVVFTRELVASKPDEVLAMRVRASTPGALTFTAALSRDQHVAVGAERRAHSISGQLPFNKPGGGGEGVRYLALLGGHVQGGTLAVDVDGIHVTGATEATLLISAGTGLRNPDFEALVRERLSHARTKTYEQIKTGAVADHARYMERCALVLPAGPHSSLPTPERVNRVKTHPDPQLAALYFQFGRHLLVSSSRPDSPLPANLQGIWADEYSTPWRGDFHSNINLQMNYWPAEVTGLPECHMPLLRFIKGVAEEGRKTARAYYNAPGWMANHTQNPWFETAPSYLPACVGPTCGAWLAQHIWTQYQYTRDQAFLKEYYPLLREASVFCKAALVEDPTQHWLVTSPSNSPENSYFYTDAQGTQQRTALCVGSTYDIQIIRGLFACTMAAARVLGTDPDLVAELEAMSARLAPTRIDGAGRIMEWQEEFEECDPKHRHISHLWGLFPGDEINATTPELFAAAQRTLERRGDHATGWSMAWKACFWARLRDGDHANILLTNLIGHTYPNLFDRHPPFQIDGNFGGTAAIAEMLMQSHDGAVTLLPALPTDWSSGSVKGLRARGGLIVDIDWNEGALAEARVRSQLGLPLVLCSNGNVIRRETTKGGRYVFVAADFAAAGERVCAGGQ